VAGAWAASVDDVPIHVYVATIAAWKRQAQVLERIRAKRVAYTAAFVHADCQDAGHRAFISTVRRLMTHLEKQIGLLQARIDQDTSTQQNQRVAALAIHRSNQEAREEKEDKDDDDDDDDDDESYEIETTVAAAAQGPSVIECELELASRLRDAYSESQDELDRMCEAWIARVGCFPGGDTLADLLLLYSVLFFLPTMRATFKRKEPRDAADQLSSVVTRFFTSLCTPLECQNRAAATPTTTKQRKLPLPPLPPMHLWITLQSYQACSAIEGQGGSMLGTVLRRANITHATLRFACTVMGVLTQLTQQWVTICQSIHSTVVEATIESDKTWHEHDPQSVPHEHLQDILHHRAQPNMMLRINPGAFVAGRLKPKSEFTHLVLMRHPSRIWNAKTMPPFHQVHKPIHLTRSLSDSFLSR